MIIIWSGIGIVVLVIGAACQFLAAFLAGAVTHNPQYYQTHPGPAMIGCAVAAVLVFLLARLREGHRDSLFFIPMGFWSIIILVVGLPLSFLATHEKGSTEVHAATAPDSDLEDADKVAIEVTASAPVKVETMPDLKLQGIFYRSKGSSTAIINGDTLSTGQKVGDLTITEIGPHSVTLKSPGGKEKILKQEQIGWK